MNADEYKQQKADQFNFQLANDAHPLLQAGHWPVGPKGYQFGPEKANVLLMDAAEKGFTSPLWLSFDQAKAAGGGIKRGEVGTKILTYYKKDGEFRPLLTTLFNAEQTYGLDPSITQDKQAKVSYKHMDGIVEKMGVQVVHDSKKSYVDEKGVIHLPEKSYYAKNNKNASRAYYQNIIHKALDYKASKEFQGDDLTVAKGVIRAETAKRMANAYLGLPRTEAGEKALSAIDELKANPPTPQEIDNIFSWCKDTLNEMGIKSHRFEPVPMKEIDPEVKPNHEPARPRSRQAERYADKGVEMTM